MLRLPILALGNLLFAAAISAMIFYQNTTEKSRIVEDAKSNTAVLRDVLAEQTEQMFASVDLALARLASALDHHGKDPAELQTTLYETSQHVPAIDTLLVLNADGKLRASSRKSPPEPVDFSTYPTFTAHTAEISGDVHLSRPKLVKSHSPEDRWLIYMSRQLTDDEGRFSGVVAAAISVKRITEFHDTLRSGDDGIVALVRYDGEILTRSPFSTELMGRMVSRETLAQQRDTEAKRNFTALVPEHKSERIFASGSLPNAPAFVYVAVSVPERLAAWRQDLITDAGVGLLAVLAFAGFTVGLRRRILRDESQREQRVAQLQRLTGLSASLMECADVQEALRVAVREARALLACKAALITLNSCRVDGEDKVASSVDAPGQDVGDLRSARERTCHRHSPGKAAADPNACAAVATDVLPETSSMLFMPLAGANGDRLGSIRIWGQPGQTCTPEQRALVHELAHITSITVQRIDMSEEATYLRNQANKALMAADEARATEVRLRRHLENILISIRDAVFSLDDDWSFIYLNPRAEEYLERRSSEVIGRSIWDILPETTETVLHNSLMKAVEEHTDVDFEFFYAPLERWFDVRAFPREEGGITVYFQDISKWIAKEEQLRQAQKMEAVGQLTGGVAHDFNNLLTVIIGNTEIVLDELDSDSRNHRLLSMTSKAADRAAELTRRLLAFSRRQPLSPRIVDIKALLDNLAPLLQRTIGEQHDVEIVAPDTVATAMIDPAQLENAIINLVLNARDAMPDGGAVSVSISEACVGEDTPELQMDTDPGRYTMITISDTGTGMCENARARAFDPFFTTKEVGSGLGLSMVFGFVKQSGGHVRIDSEIGKGTAVSVYLPISVSKGPVETRTPTRVMAWRGTENVLIVEDDPLVRSYTRSTLISLGYKVTAAPEAKAALEVLRKPNKFDLMICDVVLGGNMNGPQLVELAVALNPDLKVLYISGYAEKVIYEQKHLDPTANLLTKPFRRADLSARVRRVLTSG